MISLMDGPKNGAGEGALTAIAKARSSTVYLAEDASGTLLELQARRRAALRPGNFRASLCEATFLLAS